jgi:hemoglobin
MSEKTLYERLGGYDAIAAVTKDLMVRIKADSQLGRYYKCRGDDGIQREEQLLVDFLCSSAGGPMYYTGRDMKTLHIGMKLNENDWSALIEHLNATLEVFQVPQVEREDVVTFIQSTKTEIVEV